MAKRKSVDESSFAAVTANAPVPVADPSRTLSGNVRVSTGDFYSGTREALLLGAVFRLGSKFSTLISWSYNDIKLTESEFTTHLLTTRFAYNFSTNMFLNGLVQYNNVSDEWSAITYLLRRSASRLLSWRAI